MWFGPRFKLLTSTTNMVSNAPKYFLVAVIFWESIHFLCFISCAFVLFDQLVAKALVGTLRHHLRRRLDIFE